MLIFRSNLPKWPIAYYYQNCINVTIMFFLHASKWNKEQELKNETGVLFNHSQTKYKFLQVLVIQSYAEYYEICIKIKTSA